jgi:phage major head subunit gpT-like protein
MIIASNLLLRGIRAEFNKAMAETNVYGLAVYRDAYTDVQSNGKDETYAWLGQLPVIREWIGPKHVKALNDYKYAITNKDFEGTIAVDKNEVEDDQLGGIVPRIRMLAQQAIAFPHKLLSDVLIAGTSGLAFDGIAFFSNATGVRVNDNLLAGTGTTLAQVEVDLGVARATMMKFVDDQSQVMGIVGETVVCPPEMELTFRKILFGTTSAGQANPAVPNPLQGMVTRLIVDPRLTDVNDWYLLACAYPIRPLVYQTRKAPIFVALDKDTDDKAFWEKQYVYGVELRANAGYGFPQMACKTVN